MHIVDRGSQSVSHSFCACTRTEPVDVALICMEIHFAIADRFLLQGMIYCDFVSTDDASATCSPSGALFTSPQQANDEFSPFQSFADVFVVFGFSSQSGQQQQTTFAVNTTERGIGMKCGCTLCLAVENSARDRWMDDS